MAKETITLDPRDGAARTNLATNPKAGNGTTTGVTNTGLVALTAAVLGVAPAQEVGGDLYGLPIITAFRGQGDAAGDRMHWTAPVVSGHTYTFSAYVLLESNSADGVTLAARNASDTIKATRTPDFSTTDVWTRLSLTLTADSTSSWKFTVRQQNAGATDFYVTGVLIEESATVGDYFDGDSEGETPVTRYRWTGTPHASTSERYYERAELVLESEAQIAAGPITVREGGIDWGDAKVSNYMAEGRYGDVPVDYKMPNREVSIPLIFHGTNYDQARTQIQQKVGTFQREGGWLKRTFRDGRVLYLDIVGATLKLGGSRSAVMQDIDPDAVLTLETLPDWYGPWVHLDPIVETTDAEILSLLKQGGATAVIEGDTPGRVRIRAQNISADSQRSAFFAFRSRHYDAEASAALAVEAEALTPSGATAVATLAGASGGASNNVLQHTNLGPSWNWLTFTDHTHVGSYRVWVRARSPQGTAVSLRVEWQGLGFSSTANPAWTFPNGSGFFLADLGAVRLDRPPRGTHIWNCRIAAIGAAGGEDVQLDKVWFQPLDESAGTILLPAASIDPGSSAWIATDGVYFDFDGPTFSASGALGDLPRVPVSGAEQRPTELLLKASRGDFTTSFIDDGIDDIVAQASYRPCWMFAPES